MKAITIILATLVLYAPSYAADKKKQTTNDKIREAREKDRDAIKDFLETKDLNKDGSLTREEFISDEGDKTAAGEKFDGANKNKDRTLSKSEISDMLGLGAEVEKIKQDEKDKKNKK